MGFSVPNAPAAAFEDQAEPDSGDLQILAAGSGATGVISGVAVSAQGSPDLTVAVASGEVVVAGTRAAVTGGNLTITAADGANPRIDLVVVNNAGTKSVTAGTPFSQPVYPTIPASSVVLAAVYVPAGDTTIASNQITDKRVFVSVAPHDIDGVSHDGFPGGTTTFLRADGTFAAPPGGGVTDHGALTGLDDDDHPQYETSAEAAAKVTAHEGAGDPHTGYRLESANHDHSASGLQAGTIDHGAITGLGDDDHTQYQKESEKGAVSGYASLDGSGTVPDAQLPAAIARDSEVTTAVTNHEAAGNPHPTYETSAEAQAKVDSHAAAADPHTDYQVEKTINFDLAKARDIVLVKERAQTITLGAGQTPVHDMALANGKLYAGTRTNPFQIIRFNNLEDLTDRTVVVANGGTPGNDFNWAENVLWVPEKNRLYVAGNRSSKVVIHEIDPDTLAITTPINETITFGQGSSPALASDGTYLYIVTYNTNSKVYKYRLSDYALVAEVTLTGLANGHAMIYDGDSLYAGGNSSPAWIAKINPADLTFTSASFAGGVNMVTHPGIASVGDSVFVAIEGSPGSLWKVNKDTLALTQITGVTSQVAAVHYDGEYVWAAQYGAPGKLSRVEPATGAVETHTFASGEDHAYVMASDGTRLFMTFFDPDPNKVKRLFTPSLVAQAHSGGDHTDPGTPTTQAFGDAAVAGTGTNPPAADDHKHAMPANPVTGHEAAGDPHTGYRLESADHTHASTGLQAGTVSHGALTSVTADQHHAQSHTHASHTSIGANDHHNETHDGLKQTYRGVRVRKTTTSQVLTDSTFTVVTFNSEDHDTNAFHDTGSNTGRITIPSGMGGYYLFWGQVNFHLGTAGRRITDLMLNGSTRLGRGEASAATTSLYTATAFSSIWLASAGDYFEIHAYADGGTGATLDGVNGLVWFGATLLGV